MRARVDEQVVAALEADRDAVLAEVLARSEPLRARGNAGRAACAAEFSAHVRALAASVDLRAPGPFRVHARWAVTFHAHGGLPDGCVGSCLRALLARVGGLALPADQRALLAAALEAGIAEAGLPVEEAPALEPSVGELLHADRQRYLDAVERCRAQRGERAALLEIARIQRAVGDAWLHHQATVLEEHRVSWFATLALGMLAPAGWQAGGRGRRGPAVLAAAPGERHDLNLRIAAQLLELEGYSVEDLGADTPSVQLAAACLERKPALVGIGVSAVENLPAAREAVEMVRIASPRAFVVVGGFAARAAGAPALGADLVVPDHFDGTIPHPGQAAPADAGPSDAVR
jgi:methanogenic corrinoid protein MtbC1